jgi:hypothetical protein
MKKLATALGIAALAVTTTFPAAADCMKDRDGNVICGRGACERSRYGRVSCSRYKDGAAVRTKEGEIICGKGQCVTTSRGEVFCSTVEGGSALKDRDGKVRCEGKCEEGSASNCESKAAGSS